MRSINMAVALMLASLMVSKAFSQDAGLDQPRPNVVLIMADDLGYADLSCYGSKTIRTPVLDKLASEGVRLTSFYAGCTVCTPSRMALLTAAYPSRLGWDGGVVNYGVQPNNGLSPDAITVAEAFGEAGYQTALIGKWHLGDTAELSPMNQGFDTAFYIKQSNNQTKKLWQEDKLVADPFDNKRLTQQFADKAIEFIEKNRTKPFFLYLPLTAPHFPAEAHPDWNGHSNNKAYGDVVEELDSRVGDIVKSLERTGISERTIVVFLSDNGVEPGQKKWAMSTPYRGMKWSSLEGGNRVPCIIRWPGHIPAGRDSDAVIGAIDLFPTLTQACGVKRPIGPPRIDGISVLATLTGKVQQKHPRKSILFWHGWGTLQAIRVGNWKLYVDQIDELPDSKNGPVLIDLSTDQAEQKNVAKLHPQRVSEMLSNAKQQLANIEANRMKLGGPPVTTPPKRKHKPKWLDKDTADSPGQKALMLIRVPQAELPTGVRKKVFERGTPFLPIIKSNPALIRDRKTISFVANIIGIPNEAARRDISFCVVSMYEDGAPQNEIGVFGVWFRDRKDADKWATKLGANDTGSHYVSKGNLLIKVWKDSGASDQSMKTLIRSLAAKDLSMPVPEKPNTKSDVTVKPPVKGPFKWHKIPADYPTGIAFSPDGRLLAATSRQKLQVWSIADKKLRHTFKTKNHAHVPVFTPDSSTIVIADGVGNLEYKSTFHAWNLNTGEETTLGECMGVVHDLVFSKYGKRLVSVSSFNVIGAMVQTKQANVKAVGEITIWQVGQNLAPLKIYCKVDEIPSPQSGKYEPLVRKTVPIHLALDPDGTKLAATTPTGDMRIYDVPTGEEQLTLTAAGRMRFLDGGKIESASRIYDAKGVVITQRGELPWTALAADYALTVLNTGQISVHNLRSVNQHQSLPAPKTFANLAVSSNGCYVAVAESKTITVWRMDGRGFGNPDSQKTGDAKLPQSKLPQ